MALTATQTTMNTTRPTMARSAALTTRTATTRSVATCRSITWAVVIQVRARKHDVPAHQEAHRPRQQGELVEDHPHEGERRGRRATSSSTSVRPKSLGRNGVGRRLGAGRIGADLSGGPTHR